MRSSIAQCCSMIALLVPLVATAQTPASNAHQRSLVPATARFEVIQSQIFARSTYRLDKYTGQAWEATMRSDSTLAWQAITMEAHPAGDPRREGEVNYQLFLSGIANRFTFLLNVNNGATWQLIQTREQTLAWDPID